MYKNIFENKESFAREFERRLLTKYCNTIENSDITERYDI